MKARVGFVLGMLLVGLCRAAEYDVLVAGGGPAGIGAGYMAARRGAKVLVLEKSGRLGGMAIQAMVSPFSIATDSPFVREIVKRINAGSAVDFTQTDILAYDLLTSVGAEVLLHATVLGPVMEGNRVTGLEVLCADGKKVFKSKVVIDATGNGDVALAAGVPFEMGRDSDKLVQPMSIMYTIGGIEKGKRFFCGSEEQARKWVVPGTGKTWEAIVQAAIQNGELPPEVSVIRLYRAPFPTGNVINATQVNGLYGTKSEDLTKAEIVCRKQAVQVLNVMKKNLPGYANAYIATMPAVIGVRETRRFEGVERLEVEDCLTGRRRANAIARRCSFVVDIHNPAGGGQAENQGKNAVTGSARRVKPYDIPYGAIVPKKVDGLLLSGRCLSASHEALASCRVMGNAMATGIGAGAAAAWAVRNQIDVRKVPAEKLDLFTLDSPLNVR
ncbi:MAG: FAD-dependent oxidoreductase [Kiritimatiellae bacterium]|nr:FAD-dependent oxidoreductase [Kiritimatiellia bacterium]